MLDGTYDVAIDTPKYHKRGMLTLHSAGDKLAVRLELKDAEPLDFAGTCDGHDFTVEGAAELGSLGHVELKATGNVWGNSITASCESSIGKIELFGTQVSASTGGAQSSHDYIMQASTGEFGRDDNTMYSGLFADGG